MRPILSVLALFIAGAAMAAGDKNHGNGFDRLDADNDGFITRAEANSYRRLSEGFDAIDLNRDGQVSREEMAARSKARREERHAAAKQRWQAADADGNGEISMQEASESMPLLARHFQKIDVDGSGQLSHSEVRKSRSEHHEHVRARFAERWQSADVDGDGTLDLAEAQTGMPRLAERFSHVDVDNNGKVTQEELRAHTHH